MVIILGTHSVPLGLLKSVRAISEEIRNTQEVIGVLTHPHRFFRPFGEGGNLDERLLNPAVVEVLAAERMSCVLWNAIPGDWKDPDGWVERALAQCRTQAWTVMVLHDLPTGAMRNLELFLDATVELGIRLQQDFAPDCVPILDGRIVQPIDGILTAWS